MARVRGTREGIPAGGEAAPRNEGRSRGYTSGGRGEGWGGLGLPEETRGREESVAMAVAAAVVAVEPGGNAKGLRRERGWRGAAAMPRGVWGWGTERPRQRRGVDMARATTRWQVECACPEIFSFFAPYPLRPTEQIVLSFLRSRSAKLVPPLALSPSPSPSPFPPPPPSPAPSSSSSSSSSCPLSLFTILLRSNRRDATSVSRPCHFLSLSLFSISFWLPTFSRSALQTRVHLYSIISSSFTAFSRFSGHGRCHAVFLAVSVDVPRLIYPPYRSSPRFVLCRTQSRAKRIILVFRFVSFRFVSFRFA